MKHIGIMPKGLIPKGNIETEFSHCDRVNGRVVEYYHVYRKEVKREWIDESRDPQKHKINELEKFINYLNEQ